MLVSSARWRWLLWRLRVGRLSPPDPTTVAVVLAWAAVGTGAMAVPAELRPTGRMMAWARAEMRRARAAAAAEHRALVAAGWTLYRPA